MAYQYQTFHDAPGLVDSQRKLHALKLPPLHQKSFLDVGCNEGYYCGIALESGASRVVGLDSFELVIDRARRRFPSATFLHSDWDSLPDEKFDVILFASSMHYINSADKIERLLMELEKRMSNTGLLIIETGVSPEVAAQLVPAKRTDGVVYYPTFALIWEMLDRVGLIGRAVAESVPGDGVKRYTFHCQRRKPTVLFVHGRANSGKSVFAESIAGFERDRIVRVDDLAKSLFLRDYSSDGYDEFNGNGMQALQEAGGDSAIDKLIDIVRHEIEACRLHLACVDRRNSGVVLDGMDESPLGEKVRAELLRHLMASDWNVWKAHSELEVSNNFWDGTRDYVDCGGYLIPRARTESQLTFTGGYLTSEEALLFTTEWKEDVKASRPLYFLVYVAGSNVLFKGDLKRRGEFFELAIPLKILLGYLEWHQPLDLAELKAKFRNVDVNIAIELADHTAYFPDRPVDTNWPFDVR